MAHIIVLGNEKGGSGKSTTAIHVATALARMGWITRALDLDLRQRSFGRYIENRQATLNKRGLATPSPIFTHLPGLDANTPYLDDTLLDQRFDAAIGDLHPNCDFIVIDCPGAHTQLSQRAHGLADTLITPMNDSFIDFDVLARVSPDTYDIEKPSFYSEMVWKARQNRAHVGRAPIDWLVLRNRLGIQEMHNKRRVGRALDILSKRIGFRVAAGFSERVIFREMFPMGLTLLDLPDLGVERLSISNLAARQELRDLVKALNLPNVSVDF